MTASHRYSVSVAAAVVREDGKVLAIKRRDNGHWEPPGGVLEPGESWSDGVVREVLEETGLTVRPNSLSGVYQNLERNIIALVFRAEVVAGQLRTSAESVEVGWLSASDVRGLMTEAYAVRLLDALESPDEVKVRTHDGTNIVKTSV